MASNSSAPVPHNALPPPSASSSARSSRIAPHSHIKGLGLNSEGRAIADSAGFTGQVNAREVGFLCYQMSYVDVVKRLVVLSLTSSNHVDFLGVLYYL